MMESLAPVLVDSLQRLLDLVPGESHVVVLDPDPQSPAGGVAELAAQIDAVGREQRA